jgi:hypothetical protein
MDRSSIFKDLSYLTGSVASGRLSGTVGANQTANYLLLVKLVKKSVGLPTGGSSCCNSSMSGANNSTPSTASSESGCGCGGETGCCNESTEPTLNCCGS